MLSSCRARHHFILPARHRADQCADEYGCLITMHASVEPTVRDGDRVSSAAVAGLRASSYRRPSDPLSEHLAIPSLSCGFVRSITGRQVAVPGVPGHLGLCGVPDGLSRGM